MIDWLNVLYHLFWVLGLAVLLATFSLAHWQADGQQKSLRQSLSEPLCRLAVAVSIILFALGLMLIVEPWWYKIGWAGIIGLSAWEGMIAWREWPSQTKRS
ncbi:MAG: hypothetical protein HYR94_05015 [Chloroflexi bacterium]|nr:hypothetical protein [Chloroflexota bacterium]